MLTDDLLSYHLITQLVFSIFKSLSKFLVHNITHSPRAIALYSASAYNNMILTSPWYQVPTNKDRKTEIDLRSSRQLAQTTSQYPSIYHEMLVNPNSSPLPGVAFKYHRNLYTISRYDSYQGSWCIWSPHLLQRQYQDVYDISTTTSQLIFDISLYLLDLLTGLSLCSFDQLGLRLPNIRASYITYDI
jgi:hypothetical protein